MLLGRERECAAIDALLDGARASRSCALVIRGEPGIGKSALLRYAVDAANDMHVLSGSGVEAESELPFAGLHQLLWEVLELADALPAVQAAALRGAFGLSEERVHDRFLVSVAVLGMLTAVADRQPLLCVVDDAHWLDSGSADALTFAARRLHADAVAILIAAREGETRRFEAPGLPELVLDGLRPADASALIDGDSDLAPAVREALVRATGGNPLALRELPGALTAEQRAGRTSLDLDLPLTEGIERAFLTRVHALDDDARRLLVLAAADDTGDIGAVLRAAELLGLPATAVDAAERIGLLSTDGATCASSIRSCARRCTAQRRSASAGRPTGRWRPACRERRTPTGPPGTARSSPTRPTTMSPTPSRTLRIARSAAAGTRPPPGPSSAPPSCTPTSSGGPRDSSAPPRRRRSPVAWVTPAPSSTERSRGSRPPSGGSRRRGSAARWSWR